MVASRLLTRLSRQCVAAAAAAEPFAASFSSLRVGLLLEGLHRHLQVWRGSFKHISISMLPKDPCPEYIQGVKTLPVQFRKSSLSMFPPVSKIHTPYYSSSIFQKFGFSSVSPQQSDKEVKEPKDQESTSVGSNEDSSSSGSEKASEQGTEDVDMSKDDLVKLVHEKEELLKAKDDEIKDMKDKVLRSYAEMENIMARTKRESENSKKYAIQNFSKSLLDVADNLARASSVVKESFSKIDTSKYSGGAVPLLRTLLEGVDMTDKQLAEVLKKFGVEKFDPINEKFDPSRRCAIFQIPDPSKPPGTVASVVKVGYMLHDRVLRPADVGVTEGGATATETEEAEQPEQKTAGD
ncbi:hypothetical protein PVAP13_2KG279400 [Panicum virgatum]|uniref:GrpE protein homolog n=1 Tax=Panicum virgatum TaxID=38727 RepID=A0A8T0WCP7_PANVG|nr:hypothetical protein PVAP13_2KG279400 [Panicum virgatum]